MAWTKEVAVGEVTHCQVLGDLIGEQVGLSAGSTWGAEEEVGPGRREGVRSWGDGVSARGHGRFRGLASQECSCGRAFEIPVRYLSGALRNTAGHTRVFTQQVSGGT